MNIDTIALYTKGMSVDTIALYTKDMPEVYQWIWVEYFRFTV